MGAALDGQVQNEHSVKRDCEVKMREKRTRVITEVQINNDHEAKSKKRKRMGGKENQTHKMYYLDFNH